MEGGPEIENMVFSNNLNDSAKEEGERKQEDKKESEAEKGSGAITNFISAFVSSRGRDDQEVEEGEQVNKSDAFDEGKDEEKEGGLLNHLISMVTTNQHGNNESEVGENGLDAEVGSIKNESQEKIVEDGGGGVIHNFISNILHPNNGENNKNGEDEQVIKDGGGGGEIVENGDSHYPSKNDADDRGTEPGIEEASILIHSIVHD